MNVTDVAPVRTDQPGYLVAVGCLFWLVALFCFIRVASYVLRQARQGTLVDSPRAPLPFPVVPAAGWLFTLSVLALIFLQSPIYYVLVPAAVWAFLAAEKRSAEYQFGLGRLGTFKLISFTLVICGAVFFLEVPLSKVLEEVMDSLQVPHPLQQAVVTFQKFTRADEITVFIVNAVVIVPLVEELFFRGFLYAFLKRFTSAWGAIILSAGVFAFAHVNLGSALPLWLLGIVLAVAYEHTGSLLLPMGIHGCFNLVTAVSLLVDKSTS
jgi:membrane protease YdiL (CAAX protease family)